MSPRPIIGILGGGQLGRMLCEAAGPLGIEVAVLESDEKSPAKHAANLNGLHVTGSFKNANKIRELASRCDILSVEIEHVDTEVLEDIAKNGVEVKGQDGTMRRKEVAVHPSWKSLRLIQDKYLQKEHFKDQKLPIAEQMVITEGDSMLESLSAARDKFGYPYMLKARKGSYDGRGNFKISDQKDSQEAEKKLRHLPLYAEKWCEFVKELAVMVVRLEDSQGNVKGLRPYPAVETIHEDSICTKTYMPPRSVSKDLCKRAQQLATNVIATLWGRGVFAVEMFLLKDGSLMVNEVAPRPHNSGHYTIEAVPYMSQYKAQLYALLDRPIPKELKPQVPAAIMLNILGGAEPDSHDGLVTRAENAAEMDMHVYTHLYGKVSKPSRKIGHITVTGYSTIEALEKQAHELVGIVGKIRMERIRAEASHQLALQEEPQSHKASAGKPLVLVTMGSDSDLPVLKAGLDILEEFGVPYTVNITSAHRTPSYMGEVATNAANEGIKVIIAAAGGAAHLPGMMASHTPLPVIGVPVKATHLDGQDSLLSIVQMPRGVPVATVGINNSTNAALLSIRILGSFHPEYQEKMSKYQKSMEEGVHAKAAKLRTEGYKSYLFAMGK